jgi:galactokinase
LLAQAAEHSELIGVQCGIMDQYVSALGKQGHALLIDCFSLEFEHVPFNTDLARLVAIDTKKQRHLANVAYNQRREECSHGLWTIMELSGQSFPSIRHLPTEVFDEYQEQLPSENRQRLRHNLSENARVRSFVEALRDDDFAAAGVLLCESHASLRDDYEVSCLELDRLTEIAAASEGVYGCRLTGAGFGGCALALVHPDFVESFSAKVEQEYTQEFFVTPGIYISPPQGGASARLLTD